MSVSKTGHPIRMNEIALIDAWKAWLENSLSLDVQVWGVSILWWGRLGKLAQFLGALTIIADIIGPARLRSFGKSLHKVATLQGAVHILIDSWQWISLWNRYMTAEFGSPEAREASAGMEAHKSNTPGSLLMLVIIAITIWEFYNLWDGWWLFLPGFLAGAAISSIAVPIILIITSALLTILLVGIDTVLIEPLAWILERETVDKLIKIVSAILLLFGFHFDLLAS